MANNPYVNKVQLANGTTLIDITDTTATASDVASGKTFYLATGEQATGTSSGGSISISDLPNATGTTLVVTGDGGGGVITQDENGYLVLSPNGGGGSPSATQHEIYFEFSDSTNTTINVYYDDPLIGTMITAYEPVTYGQKTVTLAQLDGVTWYEPTVIPIGTQLIDYSKVTANTAINSQGQAETTQWYYASDYTAVESGMTFAYTASYWHYIGIYDENKDVLRTIYAYTDATVNPDDSNLGDGTLSGNELTNAKFVRICSTHQSSPGMSLIRTA